MLQDILPRPAHILKRILCSFLWLQARQHQTSVLKSQWNDNKDENCILKLEPPSNSVQNKFPKLRFPQGIGLKVQRDICFQVCYHNIWKGGSVGSCQLDGVQLPYAVPEERRQGQYLTHLLLPSLTPWAICLSTSNPSMELEQQHLPPSAIPRNNMSISVCCIWLILWW